MVTYLWVIWLKFFSPRDQSKIFECLLDEIPRVVFASRIYSMVSVCVKFFKEILQWSRLVLRMNDTGTYCRSTLKKPREKTEKTKDRKIYISSASIVLNFTHRNSFLLSGENGMRFLFYLFIFFLFFIFYNRSVNSASQQTSEQVFV